MPRHPLPLSAADRRSQTGLMLLGSSSCTNPAGGLASALGGPIVCERPTALFHVPQPLEESVFFHVVMRRHASEIVQVNIE